jgi:hypothetical protein
VRASFVAAVSSMCLLSAACAPSKEQLAARDAAYDKVRTHMKDQLTDTSRHLQPKHFDECRRQIEDTPFLLGGPLTGASKIEGPFRPHTKSTCSVQTYRVGVGSPVVYMAPFRVYVDGKPAPNSPQVERGCIFSWWNEAISVCRGAPTGMLRGHICHEM